MRSKTKLFLLSAGISITALGAVGATSFAWFTKRSAVALSFMSVKINSTSPHINVSVIPLTDAITGHASEFELASVQNSYDVDWTVSDISSRYGETFYTKSGTTYNKLTDTQHANKLIAFGLKVSTLKTGDSHNAKIKLNWSPNASGSEDVSEINEWLRGSVIEYSSAAFTEKATSQFQKTWIYEDGSKYKKYIDEESASNPTTYVEKTMESGTFAEQGEEITIFNYSEAETHYYRVAVWLEGTVAENQDAARGKTFRFNVSLAS